MRGPCRDGRRRESPTSPTPRLPLIARAPRNEAAHWTDPFVFRVRRQSQITLSRGSCPSELAIESPVED